MFKFPTSPTISFNNSELRPEEAEFILFGVPIDQRSTGRRASISAPECIRRASLELETTSIRFKVDYNKLKVSDIGDVVTLNFERALNLVEEIARRILLLNKKLIMLGGEHTFTLSTIKALKPSHLVVFDAHLDLRKEYLGEKLSHATYLRWICEYFDGLNITCVGSRGFCTEEIEYAAKKRISIISSVLLLKSFNDAYKRLSDILATADRVYISIDMDVLDPAFVNEVGNPEPEGLTPTSLFDLFELFKGKKVMGFDVMELSPTSFWNPSHYLAAKIVYELMAAVTDDPEVMISNLNI